MRRLAKVAAKKKWIQGAIKHPGALTATARRAGALKKGGGIKRAWVRKQAKKKGKIGARARLALILFRLRKRKRSARRAS